MEDSMRVRDIYAIFRQYPDIFPHIRLDKLQRQFERGQLLYRDGVVITFTRYRSSTRLGDCLAKSGDLVIHQIVNRSPGNGQAHRVLSALIKQQAAPAVWLTVRQDNKRAIQFYVRHGFRQVGNISWKDGTLPGIVMCYQPWIMTRGLF